VLGGKVSFEEAGKLREGRTDGKPTLADYSNAKGRVVPLWIARRVTLKRTEAGLVVDCEEPE